MTRERRAMQIASQNQTKAVGIWIRVSTEDQAKGESPEHHEKRARLYIESKGWTVARLYDLSGVSGKTVIDHPMTKEMMADVREGRITGLVFSKLARFARNTRELLDFADFFRVHNADLISLQESIDTSSPAGRFFYTLLAAMAQWEREETADRVSASVAVRAKLGKPLGAAPFGYRWAEGRLAIDPTEAPVLRQIFELFREHKRIKRVASILNQAGFRTRRGVEFTSSSLEGIIESTTPKGKHRVNYTKSEGRGKSWTFKPESEWVWHDVPAVVSEELWEACNAILDERARGKKPAKKAVHLFSGLAFCECGDKMYVPSNMPKYYCRGCHNKIPTGDLETVFVSRLRGFFFDEEEMAACLSEVEEATAAKRALLTTLEGEQTRVRAEADKLYRLYLDDQLTMASFGEKHKPLEERLAQLGEEIPRLQGELDFLNIEQISAADVVSQARDLYSRWGDLVFSERRAIVEVVADRIVVGKNEISIEMNYLPGPHKTVAIGGTDHRCASPRR